MFTPSKEQQAVIDAIGSGQNVKVDAVAGSGKTTTVLGISRAFPKKEVMQITFNAQLKCEVRIKAQEMALTNLRIHTYHSLATTFYDRGCHTDAKIIGLLNSPSIKALTLPKVDILIIDEAQDMTLLYFKLINKFIRDLGYIPILAIFGDRYQGVYEFMKADTRFLTHADMIYKGNFTHLSLRESYRLTKQMAWFLNNCIVNEERIVAKKNGPSVEWYIGDMYKCKPMFLTGLISDIKKGKVAPDDIFVLAVSLKGAKTPVKAIENILVEKGIPVYVPLSDECKLDDDVTRGKVVFATFPSSKGRERPIVIVVGFDDNYFNFYAKDSPKDVCPPCIYVALTRAKKRLILIGSNNASPMPFINWKHIDFRSNVRLECKELVIRKSPLVELTYERATSPTELVRFLKQETIEFLTPIVTKLFSIVVEPQYDVKIKSKIQTDGQMYEDVSDLNGLAIPSMWEFKQSNNNTLMKSIRESCNQLKKMKNKNEIVETLINNLESLGNDMTIPDFLLCSNLYNAINEGYHGRLSQIKEYTWLSSIQVETCTKALDDNVLSKKTNNNLVFEMNVDALTHTEFGTVLIRGFVDIASFSDTTTIWEIKCVDQLHLEHMLQLILYYYVCTRTTKVNISKDSSYKLLNLRSGEVRELIVDNDAIDVIVGCLISHKYQPKSRITDEEFVRQAITI